MGSTTGRASDVQNAPGVKPRRRFESIDWRVAGGIAGLLILGLILRLPSFSDAFFGDEVGTYFIADNHGIGRQLQIIYSEQEATPPLYFLLASLAHQLDSGAEWLRLPSLLAGLGLIPGTYLLGLYTGNRKAGLVGAGIATLSPFLIFYSTEARNYSTSVAIALLSTLALLRAIDTEKRGWWIAFAVFTSAAMYTHYSNAFILLGQTGWAFVARPQVRKQLAISIAGAVVLYLPWARGYIADQNSPGAAAIESLQPFDFHYFRVDLSRLVLGHPYIGVREIPGDPALLAIGLGLFIGLICAAARVGAARGWRPPSRLVLIWILASASTIGASLYSILSDDVYLSRNLISAWPAIAVLIGLVVSSAGRRLGVLATVLVLAGFAVGAVKMLEQDNQRPDYDAAARYIIANGEPDEPVVDAPLVKQTKQPLELAFSDLGDPRENTVLRLGAPTLADAYAARAPDSPGPFHYIAEIPAPEKLARQVVAEAHGGNFFLTLPGDLTPFIDTVLISPLAAQFVGALPAGYKQLSAEHFPGLFGGVSVFEYGPGGT